jgi:hypothetical protein
MALLTKVYAQTYSTETAAALCHVIERPRQNPSSCLYADCMGGQRAAWCMPRQAGCMTAPGSTAGLHTTTSCTSWPTSAVDMCLVIMRTTLPSSAWLELTTGTLFQQVGIRCMHKICALRWLQSQGCFAMLLVCLLQDSALHQWLLLCRCQMLSYSMEIAGHA